MSEIAGEIAPASPVAALSGPSFAAEVARGLPTAVIDRQPRPRPRPRLRGGARHRAASGPIRRTTRSAPRSAARSRTCWRSPAASSRGAGLGDNARAALITRGLAEMVRLGVAKGADGRHLPRPVGPRRSGADLHRRRNRATMRSGAALGRGASLAEALVRARARSSKGWRRPPRSTRLAARLGVEMPIAAAVDGVLHRGMAIDMMIERPAEPALSQRVSACGRDSRVAPSGRAFPGRAKPISCRGEHRHRLGSR